MSRPLTCAEAEARGLAVEEGIHTFSNGTDWDCWASHNCHECRFFNEDVAGKDCAFEALPDTRPRRCVKHLNK